MNGELPPELQSFVQELVSKGIYDSEISAVIEGVRLLEARERLRADLQVGIDQLDTGLGLSEDEVFPEIFEELKKIEREQTGQ